ncbi:DUF5017 domain-containing protein [Lutibacter sp. A80]|uniref:choice-of-anchor J domain-containing protein n=1 Tax=Lutibacter sp. A80 TaxID=2918453 RepID=UPI001F055F8F|nr:choice-of-anchor J domain-containing protein [Lutibacter sp. A80]UMB59703.1 DUF5017 domain-containing protein [Lutibacter sp. A80]
MKKLIYIMMVLGLVFTSCDPMDDIYSAIDAQEEVIVGDVELILTDDDYDELGVDGGFSTLDEVKTLMPNYLSDLYPVWGDGSSAIIHYKMKDGLSNLPEVVELTNAESYYLANSDYPMGGSNAIGFFPNEDPLEYIGDILEANIPSPEEGDIILTTYKQYVGEVTTGLSDYYEASFNGDLSGFEAINVMGSKDWYASSYGDYEYAKISAYGDGQNEDWLISPEIDLTDQTNASFQINQAAPFINGDWDLISVLVSTDYTTGSDHTAATWDELTIETMPSGEDYDYDYVLSELVDLSAYNGESIHVAFKYIATDSTAPTWQIDFAVIKVPGIEGTTDSKGTYFQYTNGSWEAMEGVYYLSTSDYNSMGTESGTPGRYDNFDSTIIPENYLPTFLSKMDSYAQEEDNLIVMYKYYAGTTSVKGNLYTVVDGEWTANDPVTQFGHDGNNWVPDNTIKYTFTQADYDSLGTEYGFPGYYDNFDVREGTDNYESPESILAYINTVLLNNFPGMAEGQKFAVLYDVYSGTAEVWEMRVVLSGGVYVLQ